MSASNRAKLIGKLHTALKKKYKVPPGQPTRPLLEHILYASLLEDAPGDLADEALAKCEQEFFDWNEVRVTTLSELKQVLGRLPDPTKAAQRLKGNLQSIFEEFFTFDLDHLKKENLGKAVAEFDKMPMMSPFVTSYMIQHGLGGHSVPVDYAGMVVFLVTGIVTQAEAASGRVPGLERAIPKNKGIEFSLLLHECASALHSSPKDKVGRATLDAVAKGSAEALDTWRKDKKASYKRAIAKRVEEKAAAAAKAEADTMAAQQAAAAAAAKKSAAAAKRASKVEVKSAAEQAAETAAKLKKKTAKKKTVAKEAAAKPAPEPKVKAVPSKAAAKNGKATDKTKSTAKPPAKTAPSKVKSATAKKTPAKKTPEKKTAAKKSTVKTTAVKKSPVKKAPAKKTSKKSSPKAAKKKAPATKTKPSKKATTKAKKSPGRKLTKSKPR
ncbi:MAG: hypothetical protein AAGA03_06830 [Planctomycetota bacterium]